MRVPQPSLNTPTHSGRIATRCGSTPADRDDAYPPRRASRATGDAAASNRRGLVVGINCYYESPIIPDLRGAEPDAAAYFQTLVSRGGFDPATLAALNGNIMQFNVMQ